MAVLSMMEISIPGKTVFILKGEFDMIPYEIISSY